MERSTMMGMGVGLAGAAFLGYCVYFDRRRRSAPDFQEKLKARRAAARAGFSGASRASAAAPSMPSGGSPQDMQAFFMQEVQLGEELMADGNLDEGADHLSNAVTLCGQPQALLQILQQTLPPQAFALLIQKLPVAQERMKAAAAASGLGEPSVVEDDEGGDDVPRAAGTVLEADDVE